MKTETFNKLLIFSIFFLALWFFGNFYEEVLLAPNHVSHAYDKLQLWHRYFTEVNQIYYYVPFTHLAVLTICVLYFKSNDEVQKKLLKKAGTYGILGVLVTVLIVTQLNLKLYLGSNLEIYKKQLQSLSIVWLFGNAIRLYLVGTSLIYTIKVYLNQALKERLRNIP